MSKVEFAKRIGCSRAYVWEIERNGRKPGRALAVRIEALTGIPVSSWDSDVRVPDAVDGGSAVQTSGSDGQREDGAPAGAADACRAAGMPP